MAEAVPEPSRKSSDRTGCRASRATSRANWLGHSNAIADKHYRQVTDADYDRALQKALPKTADEERSEANEKSDASEITPDVASMRCTAPIPMSPAGLEPTTYGLKVRCSTN